MQLQALLSWIKNDIIKIMKINNTRTADRLLFVYFSDWFNINP